MSTSPKISVIMPFYNCEKFLDESIKSILDQTFDDFEFIIINDASTDLSDVIVKKYISDERIRYIKNEKNVGITPNLNTGLAIARAPIIARMDGDDVSALDRFEKQYEFLLKNPDISFVGSFTKIIDENGKIIDSREKIVNPSEIKETAIYYNPLVHPSVMFRKDVVLKLGGYRMIFSRAQDIDLWLRAIYSGYLISNIPEFLIYYRHHSLSTIHDNRKNVLNDYRLRRSIIKDFQLNLDLKQNFQIIGQLFFGYFLSGDQKRWVEGVFKKIVYGYK